MLSELRDQSEESHIANVLESRSSRGPKRFEIHLHGPLDLLTRSGCNALVCRIAAADRVVRSVGLIADRVWLTDLLTEKFLDFGRPTNDKLNDIMSDVVVLARLMPLIKAGIVQFRSPSVVTCSSCSSHFENGVQAMTAEILKKVQGEFSSHKELDGSYRVSTGNCTDPPLVISGMERRPDTRRFAMRWAHNEVRSTLWTAREAGMSGGAIFSNSRIGLAGLLQTEGRLGSMKSLLLLDRQRSLNIPWVSDLNAEQILQLRQEASKALPLLREKCTLH